MAGRADENLHRFGPCAALGALEAKRRGESAYFRVKVCLIERRKTDEGVWDRGDEDNEGEREMVRDKKKECE